MIKRDELSAPISVFLNVTNGCNLRCSHCSASAGEGLEDGPELTTQEWLGVIRRLAELTVFQVTVTGGEPLIRSDLFDLLDELQRRRIVMTMNTNGTLIDADMARRLAAFPLLRTITVSLDGATAAVHDRLRGPGAFERALRGISALLDQGARVSIAAVVTRLNFDELEDMVALAAELGVVGIALNHLHPAGRMLEKEQDLALQPEDRREAGRRLAELEVSHPGFVGSTYSGWHRLLSSPPPSGNGRTHPILPCSAARESCAISADGNVLACNTAPDYVCGNVRTEDLADIWLHSPQMKAVRGLSSCTAADVVGCCDCAYRFVCSTGCRADAWLTTGSWVGGPAPACWQPYMAGEVVSVSA